MHIRPATPTDIPFMRALEQQAETAAHWCQREYLALFAPEAPERVALVAVEAVSTAGELSLPLAGFAIARAGTEEWELENIVVAPAHRRRGIARALVGKLTLLAAEASARWIALEVRESNVAAQQLYKNLGFVLSGRRKGYYQHPTEDALVLRFSFPNL